MKKPPRSSWQYAKRAEQQYQSGIVDLLREDFLRPYLREQQVMPGRPFDASRFDATTFGRDVIETMVSEVNGRNLRSWQDAARRWARPGVVQRALQRDLSGYVGRTAREIVDRNAELIRSVPEDVAQRITRYVQKQQLQGVRSDSIVDAILRRAPELTEAHAKLIARTETAKAQSALTRARAERMQLPWYQWETSEDSRVRPSHRFMDQVLVAWATAPAPEQLIGIQSRLGHYHAGNAPNCRCIALPIVLLEEITFPAKVHIGDAVVRMSRARFIAFAGLDKAA
jgi:uncharacterized protein with gpF-like domain